MTWTGLVVILVICYCGEIESARRGIQRSKESKFHKFVGIKCESLDEKVIVVDVCQLNPNAGLDFTFSIVQPMVEVMVSPRYKFADGLTEIRFQITLISSVKEGKSYRLLFRSEPIDLCSFMDGAVDSIIFKSIIAQVKVDTSLFRKCPYKGKIDVKQLDMKEDSFFAVYITGLYRTEAVVSNKAGVNVFSVITEAQITTPIKMG
jgi:hypothetical protein